MPASSVGAEHMVCLQIKPGTGRDDKNPSASDSVGVYHHRLACGKSTTLVAWSRGVWTTHKACRNPPQALSLHLPQLYVVLFLTKPNMFQHHSSCVYLTWCSVKCQPSEPCFSLATGRPRGFATPFRTCSIKTEEEVIGFDCIRLNSFFKKAK